MQSWDLDPASGDYVMDGGKPLETTSLRIPAYIRLKTSRTRWLYAPDERYGSDFYSLKKRQTTRDASQVETIAANALQPIVDDGRASEITVNANVVARHGVGMEALILRNSGIQDILVLPSLGV